MINSSSYCGQGRNSNSFIICCNQAQEMDLSKSQRSPVIPIRFEWEQRPKEDSNGWKILSSSRLQGNVVCTSLVLELKKHEETL